MASTDKTNLGLNQWVLSNKPSMEDFNEDNRIVDEELAQRPDREELGELLSEKASLTDLDSKADITYVDQKIDEVTGSMDTSTISAHNVSLTAHQDIRTSVGSLESELQRIRQELDSGAFSMMTTVNVHTIAGSACTMVMDDVSLQATADANGYAVFTTSRLGTYTLTAVTPNNSRFTVPVQVKYIGIIDVPLMSFADMSWTEIDTIAQAGLAAQVFKIGDEKRFNMTNGESVTVRIEDFEHDNLASGGKAKMTLGMKNLLADAYRMNSSNVSTGGWSSSLLRTSSMPTLLSYLPTELRTAIKPVVKKGAAGAGVYTIQTTTDSLWVFAVAELGLLNTSQNYSGEGEVYPLYTSESSRIKYLADGAGAVLNYWTRSPMGTNAYIVISQAGLNTNANASASNGVCFGFCV